MNKPFDLISKVLYGKVVLNSGVGNSLLSVSLRWHTHNKFEFCISWNKEEPAYNALLECIPCSFKNGCLLDSNSFIRKAMMCTVICQCKSCRSISAEANSDRNFNKEDANDDDSDDDYEDKTY